MNKSKTLLGSLVAVLAFIALVIGALFVFMPHSHAQTGQINLAQTSVAASTFQATDDVIFSESKGEQINSTNGTFSVPDYGITSEPDCHAEWRFLTYKLNSSGTNISRDENVGKIKWTTYPSEVYSSSGAKQQGVYYITSYYSSEELYMSAWPNAGYEFYGYYFTGAGGTLSIPSDLHTTRGSTGQGVIYEDNCWWITMNHSSETTTYVIGVVFKELPTYSVTLSTSTGISSVSGGGSYTSGSSVKISATVANGYTFYRWTGYGTPTSNPYTFTMPSSAVSMTAHATANTITISLDNQSATSAGTTAFYYKYNTNTYYTNAACSSTLSSITKPTRTGYTFGGYYTGTEGSGTQYINANGAPTNNLYTAVYSNTTLYAKWTPNTYTITLHNQSATSAGSTALYYKYNTATYYSNSDCSTKITSITVPTKTGYTFGGYYTSTNGGGTQYINASGTPVNNLYKAISANTTLYAKWTANTITITLNNQSADSAGTTAFYYKFGTSTYYSNSDCTTQLTNGKISIPTKTGYVFGGYYTSTSGGGTQYIDANGAPTGSLYSKVSANTTLYAKWTNQTYTITYALDGGNSAVPANKTLTYAESYNLAAAPTKTGYTFFKWKSSQNKEYNAGDSVSKLTTTHGATITMTATWTPIEYTISYDPNGGAGGGALSSNHVYDKAQNLTKNIYSLLGHTFAGWALSADAETPKYSDQQSVTNLRSTPGTVTLYAVWTPITYKIIYDLAGGTGTATTQVATYGTPINLHGLPSLSKYAFVGYLSDSDGQTYGAGAEVHNLASIQDAEVKMTAQWELFSYNIVYDLAGGTGTHYTQTPTEDEEIALHGAPTKDGYSFQHWYCADNNTEYIAGAKVINLSSTHGENINMTAVWSPIEYTVLYNPNKGTGTMDPSNHTYDAGDALRANTFTRDGYTFAGWSKEQSALYAEFEDKSTENITTTAGEVTIYAVWMANTYTITYEVGAGSIQPSNTPATYDKTVTLAAGPTKTGYKFTGWLCDADNKTYTPDSLTAINLTTEPNSLVTMTAQWELIKYTIKYDLKGGTGTATEQTVTYGDPVTLHPAPTLAGYKATEWYGTNNATYTAGASYSNLTTTDGDVIEMTPIYVPNSYTITYDLKGGKGDSSHQPVKYDDIIALHVKPTREGYTFQGFHCSATGLTYDGGVNVSKLTTEDNGVVEMVAQWQIITYTVTYSLGDDPSISGTATPHESIEYNQNITLHTAPTRTGYNFSHFESSEGGVYDAGKTYKNLTLEDNKNVVLSAVWTPISYTIVYDGNGGSGQGLSNSSIFYDTAHTLPENPYTRPGYNFHNWTTSVGGAYEPGDDVSNLTTQDGDEVTILPNWTPIEYTVAYMPNGGTGDTMTPSNHVYDQAKNLTLNTYTRLGYTFSGWALEAGAKEVEYTDGDEVINLTETENAEVPLYAVWTPIEYTVTYNRTTATSGEMASSKHTYDTSSNLSPNAFTKTGYDFVGWADAENSQTKVYGDKGEIFNLTADPSETITLYALWVPIEYTVAYNPNTGTGTMAPSNHVYDTSKALTANEFTKTGYTFTGWALAADAQEVEYADKASVKNLRDTAGEFVLYAIWAPIQYTIAYEANGGDSTPENQTATYDATINLAGEITQTGYEFTGWLHKETQTVYAKNESVKNLADTAGATATMVAQWRAITYTIKYASAGEVSLPKSVLLSYGETIALADKITRTGYIFQHWTDANSKIYPANTDVKNLSETDGATITMTAVWTPIEYTVSYNSNTGTGTQMEASTHTYDIAKALSANTYLKLGYNFTGWAESPNAIAATYADKKEITNLRDTSGEEVILYAIWKPITYTIKYISEGEVTPPATQTHTYDTEKALADKIERTGYIFQNWSGSNGTEYDANTPVKNLTTTQGDEIIMTAVWTPIQYTISYDSNTGTGDQMANSTHTYDITAPLTENTYTKVGYNFAGWSEDPMATLVTYTDKEPVTNLRDTDGAQVVLYAVWAPITYTIKYISEGEVTPPATQAHTYDEEKALADKLTRTGYIFQNWSDDEGTLYTAKQGVTNLTTIQGAEITMTAVWKAIEYTVSYDSNTGTGTQMSASTHTYDTTAALTENTYTKEGYIFTGWAQKADAIEIDFVDKEEIINLRDTDGAEVTLYAVWTPITYTIKYSSDGEVTLPATQTMTYDAEASIADKIERTGYIFQNWSGSNGTEYDANTPVKNLTTTQGDEIIMTAVWQAITYNVTYDAAQGTPIPDAHSATYDIAFNLPDKPTKIGYLFTGWKLGETSKVFAAKEEVSNLATTQGATVTLTAQWSMLSFTVKYDLAGGQGIHVDQPTDYGADLTLHPSPSRTGYDFEHWSSSAGGTYDAGATINTLIAENGGTITMTAVWTPIEYTVAYNSNTGSGKDMPSSTHKYDEAKKLTANTYTKTGYVFSGWARTADAEECDYADTASVTNLSTTPDTITLYAVWTPITYTIKYVSAGDVTLPENQTAHYDKVITLAGKIDRTGYVFNQWACAVGGTYAENAPVSNLTTTQGDVITMTATWTPIQYTVAYNANGGTGEPMTSSTHTYDSESPLTTNSYTRTGYSFSGWAKQALSESIDFADKAPVSNLLSEAGEITLYAIWAPITYKIVYSAEGASSVPDTQIATYDQFIALAAGPVLTGYLFDKWTSAVGGPYEAGESVENLSAVQDSEITMTATWTPITYKIAYNAAGGINAPAPQTATYDVTLNLAETDEMKKTGYMFSQWKNLVDGETYSDGAEVENLSSTQSATVTLTAIWTPITYKIAYVADGASSVPQTQTVEYDAAATLATEVSKTGYDFVSWSCSNGSTYSAGQQIKNLSATLNEVLTMTALWTPINYRVEYNPNGGTGENMSSSDHTYDSDKPLSENTYTKPGYTFAGWSETPDAQDPTFQDKEEVSNLLDEEGSKTLYATWKANTYTIEYDAAGGLPVPETQTVAYDETINLSDEIEKLGYVFKFWTSDAGWTYDASALVKNLTTENGATIIMTATWTAITYTIAYNSNGGTGTAIPSSNHTYDVAKALTKNTFVRDGYKFLGWARDSLAVDAEFEDEEAVVNVRSTTGQTTLYAVWQRVTFNVTIENGTVDGSDDSSAIVNQNDSVTITARPPEPGKVFKGWSVDGEIVADDPTYTFSPSDHMTIVAVYEDAPSNLALILAIAIGVLFVGVVAALALNRKMGKKAKSGVATKQTKKHAKQANAQAQEVERIAPARPQNTPAEEIKQASQVKPFRRASAPYPRPVRPQTGPHAPKRPTRPQNPK